jgi:hypothetical protein
MMTPFLANASGWCFETKPNVRWPQKGNRRLLVSISICVGLFCFGTHYAVAKPIKGETATASSFYSADDRAPIHVVDDSGLMWGSPSGAGHNVRPSIKNVGTMWLSTTSSTGPADPDPWLIIDLGNVYQINRFHVWNYNETAGSGHGIKNVDIRYSSTDPKATDNLLGAYVFAKGVEQGKEYLGEDFTASFQARYIKLDINSNWDGDTFAYGLSEIQFYGKSLAADAVPEVRLLIGAIAPQAEEVVVLAGSLRPYSRYRNTFSPFEAIRLLPAISK